jgi:prepilin-type N-terminal cleavage/methylation domain-containing protein
MKGFTLIEMLVVIVIISILAAIGIPIYLNSIERAKETEIFVMFDSLDIPIEEYRILNNRYPADVNAGINPGLAEWPTTVPFDSVLDYEHWGIGGGVCVVLLTYFGENKIRNSITHVGYGPVGSIIKNDDDYIKTVAVYECEDPRGSVR